MSKWPISLNDITRLQIEVTSFCNANCPSCERYEYFFESTNPYSRKLNDKFIKLKEVGLNRITFGMEHGNEKFRREVDSKQTHVLTSV